MTIALAIYDMDRTITRRGTYTPWLLFWAWKMAPWRLLLLPLALVAAGGYLLKFISRQRFKEIYQALLMGSSARRGDVERVATLFARRVVERGLLPGAVMQIVADRNAGRRLVMATASYDFCAASIADELGGFDVIATQSTWHVNRLLPRIEGLNCYGEAKADRVRKWLDDAEFAIGDIRVYSDHASDAPLLSLADTPVAVNASAKLRALARRRGWQMLDWSKASRSRAADTGHYCQVAPLL